MVKTSKSVLVLVVVVFCAVFLAGISVAPMAIAEPAERRRAPAPEQVQDQHKDSRILVEAFVVEVKLETLYKSGVSPIGQKPNSVSIKNILQCLKVKDGGKVTAGAKVAIRQKEDGNIQEQETKYVERERQVRGRDGTVTTQKVFDDYSIGMTFNVKAIAKPEDKIWVEFSFNQSGFVVSKKEMPPNKISRQWNGTVCLGAGEPSIVGATQNEETAVFLILCADIENE